MKPLKKDPNHDIYVRDNWTCKYCGIDCSNDFETWWRANLAIDHLIPRKHGGTDESSNLVVACHTCNLYKGDAKCFTIEEAKTVIDQRKEQASRWYQEFV